VGRRTSFEVKVNGKLVHSKLSTMAFPDFPEVVSIVQVSALCTMTGAVLPSYFQTRN
jgi:hypothetical protein